VLGAPSGPLYTTRWRVTAVVRVYRDCESGCCSCVPSCWQAVGTHWLLAAARHAGTPSVVRLRHQPHELRNDTRALRWPWFSNQKAAIVDGERGTEAAEPHLLHLRYLLVCRRRLHLGQQVLAHGRSAALRVAARGQRRPHWTITSRVLWCRPIDGCEATWHSQSCGGKKLRGIAIRRTQEAECAPRKQPSSDAELSPSPRAQSSACWRVRAHLLAPDSRGERQMGGKAGADKHRDLGLRRRAHAPRPTG
jgi:hypothetical protein